MKVRAHGDAVLVPAAGRLRHNFCTGHRQRKERRSQGEAGLLSFTDPSPATASACHRDPVIHIANSTAAITGACGHSVGLRGMDGALCFPMSREMAISLCGFVKLMIMDVTASVCPLPDSSFVMVSADAFPCLHHLALAILLVVTFASKSPHGSNRVPHEGICPPCDSFTLWIQGGIGFLGVTCFVDLTPGFQVISMW